MSEPVTQLSGREHRAASADTGETALRFDWSVEEVLDILQRPLMQLLYDAQTVHRAYHTDNEVQLASLLSIKTGSCPEDCKYCPQSAHYAKNTGLEKEALLDVEDVLAKAEIAKGAGATRFCMGAAWRQVRDGREFDQVIEMVEGVTGMGMEACVTLGMLTQEQADRLAAAGLKAYNHNLDTSPEFYGEIISTRTYQDRLNTLHRVRNTGVTLCSGGIIGMGESLRDRASMLQVLATLDPHPESMPINALVPVPGTPLADKAKVSSIELVRMVATARIVMPKARVRSSAGRAELTKEAQLLCFMAGANSIFYGEKLLTTANNDAQADLDLIAEAGLQVQQTS